MSVPCNLSSRPHGLAARREGDQQDLVLYVNGVQVSPASGVTLWLVVCVAPSVAFVSPLWRDPLACTRGSLRLARAAYRGRRRDPPAHDRTRVPAREEYRAVSSFRPTLRRAWTNPRTCACVPGPAPKRRVSKGDAARAP